MFDPGPFLGSSVRGPGAFRWWRQSVGLIRRTSQPATTLDPFALARRMVRVLHRCGVLTGGSLVKGTPRGGSAASILALYDCRLANSSDALSGTAPVAS